MFSNQKRPTALFVLGLTFLFSLGISPKAYGLDIYAMYSANCQRQLGVILEVDNHKLDVLSIEGSVLKIPRYKIIYMATYPLDIIPVQKFKANKPVTTYEIKSLVNDKIEPLLKGWPVNFTKGDVSFLTDQGRELLVPKSSLWSIRKSTESKDLSFNNRATAIGFQHPYPFSHCQAKRQKRVVIPQKLFTDAVDIKHELDRLQEGQKELGRFIRRQSFYAKPEIYTNKSKIGMWLMADARYGKSESRSNNFAPFVSSELSSGAYSYQHELETGSGPFLYGSHGEIQTQFYYRMKAEYIHFSTMLDPSLLLVGTQYDWRDEDLDNVDLRLHESNFLEFGFDIGPWSLELGSASTHFGSKLNSVNFFGSDMTVSRVGFRYTGIRNTFIFMQGSGSEEFGFVGAGSVSDQGKMDVDMTRLNHIYVFRSGNRLTSSLIMKEAKWSSGTFDLELESTSAVVYYEHQWKARYYVSGLLGVENYEVSSGSQNEEDLFLLFGLNASLQF